MIYQLILGSLNFMSQVSFKNLHMYGRDLPVEELEKAFLFFYRLKHFGKKNFIENFHNFDGKMDVDLRFSKSGVNGKCHTHGLRADFSKFMIPVVLPDVVFEFKDRNMQAKANGTFGTEPVLYRCLYFRYCNR